MPEALEDYALNKKKITQKGIIQKVGIVGCGTMGQEITRVISKYGVEVVYLDLTEELIKKIREEINKQLDEEIAKWGLTNGEKRAIMSRINGTTDYKELRDCDIVIEAINSQKRGTNLEIRKDVFRKIEAIVPENTIIVSSTATLMISDIAMVLEHPERAAGIHFIPPASRVSIIEVTKGIKTSDETFEAIKRFASMINKTVIALHESPGNVSTRLIVPLINEACGLVMEGIATIPCIDKTMKAGFGMRFGPLELADRIGLDKILKYMDNLHAEYGEHKYKASPLIKRLVRDGFLGRKSEKGFYIYEEGKIAAPAITYTEFR